MYSGILRKTILPYALKRDNRESALGYWREYEVSQYWPRQKLLDYQWEKLRLLIAHSYNTSPYYREIFDRRGLRPESFKSADDLSMLPILTRDIIFARGEDILSRALDKAKIMSFQTGGTTGQQATMFRDQESYNHKLAIEWRHEGWMGRKPCDKTAYLWPAHIDFVEHASVKARIKNRFIMRQLVLNAGTFNEKALRSFHNDLNSFKPQFLKVFPASLFNFVEYLEEKELRIPPIKGIMCSGEKLYDFQRSKFESYFGCPVFDMYGTREAGNSASECPAHAGMHIAMEISVVEFHSQGRNVEYGQQGEIIITDLTNYAMPLLRYRIDDYGIPLRQACSCGRTLPLMSTVVGRFVDDFWGPDGTRHSGNVLGIHLTVGEEGIVIGQAQFIQKAIDQFLVRLTNRPEPTPKTFEFLTRRMKEIIGDSIHISFEVVENIPLEKSGKTRYVKCEIDPPPNAKPGRRENR